MLLPAQKRQLRERADAARAKRAILSAKRLKRTCLAKGKGVGSDVFRTSEEAPIGGSQFFLRLHRIRCEETIDEALETLDDDCLLHIMQHTRLTPDLENMLAVSNRCRNLWKNKRKSILKGMQREQFPEYLEIFGELGHQSDKQLRNLLCAHATDFSRCGSEPSEPEKLSFINSFLSGIKQDISGYERCFIIYLGDVDDELNDQVRRLHDMDMFDSSSRHVTKVAVITLWGIGWRRPTASGEWLPNCSLAAFKQQPEEVRHRMRDIIEYLSCEINDSLGLMSYDGEEWIENEDLVNLTGLVHIAEELGVNIFGE